MIHTLVAPLYVEKNKKGDRAYINLNNYRNWHYQASNNYKKKYKEALLPQIIRLPSFKKISLEARIWAKDKRLFDIDNIGSIHIKFALDALTEAHKIEDDNYLYVPETTTRFMGIDRDNPRVEFIIKEL